MRSRSEPPNSRKDRNVQMDHDYIAISIDDKESQPSVGDLSIHELQKKHVLTDVNGNNYLVPGAAGIWKVGRRVIEWDVLLQQLQWCPVCKLGPVPLTRESLVGELQKGLGGYIYVRCSNHECQAIVRAPYGKTHHVHGRVGMPCFAVNTKLGTG